MSPQGKVEDATPPPPKKLNGNIPPPPARRLPATVPPPPRLQTVAPRAGASGGSAASRAPHPAPSADGDSAPAAAATGTNARLSFNPLGLPAEGARAPPVNSTEELHKMMPDELMAFARKKGLPNVDRMDRDNLMEFIREVVKWESMEKSKLVQVADTHGYSVMHGGSRDALLKSIISQAWGRETWERERRETEPTSNSPSADSLPAAAAPPRPQPSVGPTVGLLSPPAADSPSPKVADEESRAAALAAEVNRIMKVKGDRQVLGFLRGEPMTLKLAKTRYRQLMLLLHPDKRTAAGVEKARGLQACEKAMERVQEAHRNLVAVLSKHPAKHGGSGRSSSSSSSSSGKAHEAVPAPPRPHAAPPPQARPKPPPGSKPARKLGWGPIGPLPPPRPNFGMLRVVVVG